jgi:ABC-type transport system involved in multi-copper enzyme maturation permease subunit
LPDREVDSIYIFNRGANPATVKVYWSTTPTYLEVYWIPVIALAVALFFIGFMCASALAPKVSAIALATFKTEIGQPLFLLVLILGALFIVLSIYVPYNTFGEDIKMYKDSGLTLIRVLAIFTAIWAASKSVAEEIEGRTALTVLSKPVGRREFILGKFFGITAAMTWLFVLLGFWFVFWVSYKPLYDAVESTASDVDWTDCFQAATSVLPILLLAFMEVVIFVAISVAVSTRFGILANLMICFAIYILGHLTPQLVQSNQLGQALGQAFEPVVFFGQLVAIIFPVLDHFDAQTAINTDTPVPFIYLGWSFIYTLLYGSLAVLLALVLFEDRDLA